LFQRAYRLRRDRLGQDHPDTLSSAADLAWNLRALGDYQQARTLDEDILTRRRRVLGDDHPATLISAGNLAGDLHALGEDQQAVKLRIGSNVTAEPDRGFPRVLRRGTGRRASLTAGLRPAGDIRPKES